MRAAALLLALALGVGTMHAAPLPAAPAAPAATSPAATSPATDDIRDIRGPKPIGSAWLLWVLPAAAAVAAVAAYALWRRRRRRRTPPPPTDLEVALARLAAAQALLQPGRARDFSIEVSAAVREYIERRFQVLAAHRTTDEFLHDLMGSSHAELASHREPLGEFLQSCDLAKFGGWNLSTGQMGTMLEGARRFVQSAATVAAAQTRPGPPVSAARPGKTRDSLPST